MKSGPTQTQTNALDPQTQQYVNAMRSMASGYAGGNTYGGPNPNVTSAMSGFQGTANAGAMGEGALTGNSADFANFMNPYLSQMDPLFAQMRAGAVNSANQQATQEGAFGGSGQQLSADYAGAQSDINKSQFDVNAVNTAQQNALQMANLGFGANQSLMQGGQYLFGLPQQWQAQQLGLLNGSMGPYGTTQSTPTQYSPLLMAGGLAASLFGGPLGGMAGGAISAAGMPHTAGGGGTQTTGNVQPNLGLG